MSTIVVRDDANKEDANVLGRNVRNITNPIVISEIPSIVITDCEMQKIDYRQRNKGSFFLFIEISNMYVLAYNNIVFKYIYVLLSFNSFEEKKLEWSK